MCELVVGDCIVVTRRMTAAAECAVRGSTRDEPCCVAAQVFERRCIRRVVSKASGAVHHYVDALALRRLDETTPCAGGVREASDDGRAVDVLQSRGVQSVAAQHSQSVVCLCARRHESLDVLTDRTRGSAIAEEPRDALRQLK